MDLRRTLDRVRRIDPLAVDIALAVVCTVVGVGSQFGQTPADEAFRDTDLLAVLLGICVGVPVAWRRRRPLPALVVSTTAITLLAGSDYRTNALPIVVLFLVYATAAYLPMERAVVGVIIVNVALLVIWATQPPDLDFVGTVLNMALFTGTWFGGLTVRSRAAASEARLAELEERAEAHRQQAARAVAEERLRIAQELHDVVAHSMSVIAVQAGMGVHVIDQQPAAAREALEAISRTSRSTLQEMRRLLGVLRGEEGSRVHAPAPGLGDLPALVEDVRAAGLDVTLCVEGEPTAVPLGVDLSAFRVVQEGLTNVMKHAGQARAEVHVRYGPALVEVEVRDDGRGAAAAASPSNGGHGLIGMRERVGVWGGTLEAGPVIGGGYRVLARIPYGDES